MHTALRLSALVLLGLAVNATGALATPPHADPVPKHDDPHPKIVEIRFQLGLSEELSKRFRIALITFATRYQLRDGPVGVGPARAISPSYSVIFLGECPGAIAILGSRIGELAEALDGGENVIRDYSSSATCVEWIAPHLFEDFTRLR